MKKTSKRKAGFEFSSDLLDLWPEKKLVSFQRGLWFSSWMSRGFFSRVMPKRFRFSWKMQDFLTPTAQGFGLDEDYLEKVRIHKKRLDTRLKVTMGIMMPFYYLLAAGIFAFFGYLIIYPVIKNQDIAHFEIAIYLFLFYSILTLYPLMFFLTRLFFLVVDRLFSDSICAAVSVGVLVELVSPYSLSNPYRRRILLAYINDLARYTQLLPLTFASPSEEENEIIRKRFRALESYIREQARMAVFSTTETLDTLRENFMMLTRIFISGNYGDFSPQEDVLQLAPEKPLTSIQILGKWLGRLIGVGLPAAGLYFLITRPALFSNLPVDSNLLLTIGMAWLALSVDSVLGLGVTAKIIATAKEFRKLV